MIYFETFSHQPLPSTFSRVYFRASFLESWRHQSTLLSVAAPSPWLPYSAYRAVFSFSGLRQFSHPSERMWPPSSQSMNTTAAIGAPRASQVYFVYTVGCGEAAVVEYVAERVLPGGGGPPLHRSYSCCVSGSSQTSRWRGRR